MSRVNFEIQDDIHKMLTDQCKLDGRSISDVLRTLVIEYTEKRIFARKALRVIKIGENVKDG